MSDTDRKHPTRENCLSILYDYGTPQRVIAHCKAVTDAALKIATALNMHGYDLGIELIRAAGLLHDIARVEDLHWEVGARKIRELGYEMEADIIRAHMLYSDFSPIEKIKEIDIVCIGDRLVRDDRYVGMEARMQYIIEKVKSQGRSVDADRIREKMAGMGKLLDDIEKATGMEIDEIMKMKGIE